MPLPIPQYDPNAFSNAFQQARGNRLQDVYMQRDAEATQYNRQRQTAADQRVAVRDEQDLNDREREILAKVYAPLAQQAVQSGDVRGFYASALANPQVRAQFQRDGFDMDEQDLQDPDFEAQIAGLAQMGGPQKPVDPGPLETIVGPDGKPVLQPRSKAVGQTPYTKPEADSGFTLSPGQTRYGPDGKRIASVEPKPEGDPSMRDVANLRKEFEGTPEVKNYRSVLPLYDRAKKAPNTRAGDLSIIYALGKMFDPTSVVREGELILAKNTAPWLQKLASTANSQITGKGALNPQTRSEIMAALDGQVEAFRQPYEQQRKRFGSYATDYGIDPFKVTGDDAKDAFSGSGTVPAQEITATNPQTGQKIVFRNGQWVPL